MRTHLINPLTRLLWVSITAGVATGTVWAGEKQAGVAGSQEHSAAGAKEAGFIRDAARANDSEVALAEIGVRKAQNADLKTFCQQMQQDHIQANKDLQPLAQKYGVSIDQPVQKRPDREMSRFDKAQAGSEFDQKLATEFLKNHQKTIAKFQKAANQLEAADVKQYAQTMLPKLQEHLHHAEAVAQAVGVDNATISSIVNQIPAGVGGTGEEEKTEKGAGARDLQQSPPASRP